MDCKLNLSRQCDAAVKKTNAVLGCINRGITLKSQDVIVPLCTALVRLHLKALFPKGHGQNGEGAEESDEDDPGPGDQALGGKGEGLLRQRLGAMDSNDRKGGST